MTGKTTSISAMNLHEVSERVRLYRETHAEIGQLCAVLYEKFGLTWDQVAAMIGHHKTTAIKWADEWRVASQIAGYELPIHRRSARRKDQRT